MLCTYLGGGVCCIYGYLVESRVDPGRMSGSGHDNYGISQSTFLVYCDNMSAIDISKNPVQHSRTKHNFIRDLVDGKLLTLTFVPTEKQLADIFTKALDNQMYEDLRQSIGLCEMN